MRLQKFKIIMNKTASFFGVIKYSLTEGVKLQPSLMITLFFQSLISIILPFINILMFKLIVDEIAGYKNFKQAAFYSAVLVVSHLVLSQINVLLYWSKSNSFIKLGDSFNVISGSKIMQMDFKNLENSEIMNKFQHSYRACFAVPSICEGLCDIFTSLIQIIGSVAILFTLHPVFVIINFLTLSINFYAQKRAKTLDNKIEKESAVINRRMEYFVNIMLSSKSGKELRLFSGFNLFKNKYSEEISNSLNLDEKRQKAYASSSVVNSLTSAVQLLVVYAYLVYTYVSGKSSIGNFSLFTGAVSNLTNSFNALTNSITSVLQNDEFLKIFWDYQNIPDTLRLSGSKKLPDKIGEYEIEFKNVSFRYPGTREYVLKNLNIKIKNGEKISIVGYNGAGKTTFIKLLTRLYDPSEGKILLNGLDIRDIDYNEYMSILSPAFQDFKLFAYTLKENIVLDYEVNEDKLRHVLEETGIYEKISGLQNNIDTFYTKSYETEGVEFSGGESQKLAIARAFYKDGDIAILDEPTSAIDPISEYYIYKNVNDSLSRNITIYICHRMSSSKFSDRIIFFKDGEIAEQGDHSELISNNGFYTQMYRSQATFYK